MRRKHIRVDVDENIVYVYCNFSKTDQFGDHDLVIRIPGNTNPCMDLVRYIDQLFSRVRAEPDSPAFIFAPSRFVHFSLFTTRLKSLFAQVGLDPLPKGSSFLYKVGGISSK